VSGLSVYAQGDLFAEGLSDGEREPVPEAVTTEDAPVAPPEVELPAERRWWPGQDVHHDELGPGWMWGRGLGRVTVRFEGPRTAPGPVRTLAADDPLLQAAEPPDWRTPA
jgi:DNA polymerase-4